MDGKDAAGEQSVSTDTMAGSCDYCHEPIDPRKHHRKIKARRFCSDRHRTLWHAERKKALLLRLRATVAELSNIINEMEGK